MAVTDVERFYDQRYASGYMDEWPEWKKRRIREIIGALALPATGAALDFGCGQGVLTDVVREALPGWSIYGTDLSPNALRAARARFPSCTFVPLSALERKSAHPKFDLLFSHHVLEHVVDLDGTWDFIVSVLTDAAWMVHVLPCGDAGSLEYHICAAREGGIESASGNRFFFEEEGHLRRLRTADIERAARPYGFDIVSRRYGNRLWGAIDWITAGGPAVVRTITDAGETRRTAASLRLVRAALLGIAAARWPIGWFRTSGKRVAARTPAALAKYAIAVAAYGLALPIDRILRRQADREWTRAATGSEMYVSLVRQRPLTRTPSTFSETPRAR